MAGLRADWVDVSRWWTPTLALMKAKSRTAAVRVNERCRRRAALATPKTPNRLERSYKADCVQNPRFVCYLCLLKLWLVSCGGACSACAHLETCIVAAWRRGLMRALDTWLVWMQSEVCEEMYCPTCASEGMVRFGSVLASFAYLAAC